MSKHASPSANPPAVVRHDRAHLDPELRQILGPPPLYEGESQEDYNHLYERFRSAVAPTDVIEEIWVRDITDLSRETLRLRRLKARLMEAAAAQGLGRILETLVPNHSERKTLVEGWARGEAGAKKQVTRLLAKAGLDREAIEAQTLSARIDDFERIDRMVMQSEARRNVALREIDRHRDAVARRLHQAMTDIEDAEFEEVSSVNGEVRA